MEQCNSNEKVDQRDLRKYSHFVLEKDMMLVIDDASIHKIYIAKNKID